MANSADPGALSVHADVRAGRAALLDLLADLLLRELDEPLARHLATDPTLRAQLQPPQSAQELHALRGEYSRLFLLEAPPYASIYLDDPPMLSGESSARWEATLARLGYAPASRERVAASDHAGLALRALAWAERTSDALGAGAYIARVGGVLAVMIRWLPQYLTALGRESNGSFYGRVAEMTSAVVHSCASEVTPTASLVHADTVARRTLPGDDDLRSLTRWLATPVQSGWYLSKEQIRQLARRIGVGSGMVERERMLEQVFEATGLDNRTAELLDVLLREWGAWSQAAAAWTEALRSWAPALDTWRAALDQCYAILSAMREEASHDV